MLHLRVYHLRLFFVLIAVMTVSIGLHHYACHSPGPQRMRRNAAVPEPNGGNASAKLRSASDDTSPRGISIRFGNSVPGNTIIESSDHEESVLSSSTTTRRQHFSTHQAPPCALNSKMAICVEDNEYDEQIAQVIRAALKNSHVGALLQDPVVRGLLKDSTLTEEDTLPSSGLAPRLGPGENERAACRSQKGYHFPPRGHNMNNTWFFIVNQDYITQTIVYEKCIGSNAKCEMGFSGSPTVRTTTCKQKHIYRKMFVLNDAGLNVTEEEILIPSCCACFVSNSDTLESGN